VTGSPPMPRRPPPRPRSSSGVEAIAPPAYQQQESGYGSYHGDSGGYGLSSGSMGFSHAAVPTTSLTSTPARRTPYSLGPPPPTKIEEKPAHRSKIRARGSGGGAGHSKGGPPGRVHDAPVPTTPRSERQLNTPINFDMQVAAEATDAPHYSEGTHASDSSCLA
jgi:hypothetical protein